MKKKSLRIETSGPDSSLTHNPFSRINMTLPEGPNAIVNPELPEQPPQKPDELPFSVARTRKGGWHITVERRPSGKTVTVVHGVEGDAEALCTRLKKKCATGGTTIGTSVELQGNHKNTIELYLTTI